MASAPRDRHDDDRGLGEQVRGDGDEADPAGERRDQRQRSRGGQPWRRRAARRSGAAAARASRSRHHGATTQQRARRGDREREADRDRQPRIDGEQHRAPPAARICTPRPGRPRITPTSATQPITAARSTLGAGRATTTKPSDRDQPERRAAARRRTPSRRAQPEHGREQDRDVRAADRGEVGEPGDLLVVASARRRRRTCHRAPCPARVRAGPAPKPATDARSPARSAPAARCTPAGARAVTRRRPAHRRAAPPRRGSRSTANAARAATRVPGSSARHVAGANTVTGTRTRDVDAAPCARARAGTRPAPGRPTIAPAQRRGSDVTTSSTAAERRVRHERRDSGRSHRRDAAARRHRPDGRDGNASSDHDRREPCPDRAPSDGADASARATSAATAPRRPRPRAARPAARRRDVAHAAAAQRDQPQVRPRPRRRAARAARSHAGVRRDVGELLVADAGHVAQLVDRTRTARWPCGGRGCAAPAPDRRRAATRAVRASRCSGRPVRRSPAAPPPPAGAAPPTAAAPPTGPTTTCSPSATTRAWFTDARVGRVREAARRLDDVGDPRPAGT